MFGPTIHAMQRTLVAIFITVLPYSPTAFATIGTNKMEIEPIPSSGPESTDSLSPVEFPRDPAVVEWVKNQNQRSREYLGQDAEMQRLLANRAAELIPGNASVKTDLDGHDFVVSKGSLVLQGNDGRADRTLVDSSRLPPGSVVTEYALSPDQKKLAYGFTVYGTDWTTWHVIDFESLKPLAGPYYVKSSGNDSIVWDLDSQGFFYSRTSPSASADDVGIRRPQIRYHRLGTAASDDAVVFEDRDSSRTERYKAYPLDAESVVVYRVLGGAEVPLSVYLVNRDGTEFSAAPVPLVKPHRDWGRFVGAKGSTIILRTSQAGPRYGLVAIDTKTFRTKTIVPQRADVLIQAQQIGDKLVLQYLDRQLRNYIKVTDLSGRTVSELKMSQLGYPDRGTLSLFTGNQTSKESYFTYHATTMPTETLRFDVASGSFSVVAGKKIAFDGSKIQEELKFYRSTDGRWIPIQVFTRKDRPAPSFAYLFFYGNIGIASTSQFNRKFQLMLEMGGMVAIANVRGGGEFGLRWQQAGTFQRWNWLQDIASAGRWLKSEYPSLGDQVALSGRSFGGMGTMAAYVHFQDDFAVFTPTVAVSDPSSFVTQERGWWAWDDIGFRRDSNGRLIFSQASFNMLRSWSPMANIGKLRKAKPLMAFSGQFDVRVGPDQTVVFVRRLQEQLGSDAPIYMIEHENIGHNGRAEIVDEAAFIARQFGIKNLDPMK